MTASKYPDDFRDRFRRQEWNNLTEMQKEVMCRQYELYDALRRTGSEVHQPSFMLAHDNKMRHSPCSMCCGDERFIAHRAMFFKELEDELEEQHERRLSQQTEEASPRKRRVKSQDSASRDPTPRRSVSRTTVGGEHSSKCTKRKQRSSVRRRKEDSKPRDRTSSKHRAKSEQPRKKSSVKKKSHSTNRTASDPCNTGSCNQRSKLRKKTSYKRSSEINNKPLSDERPTACKNTFEFQECFYDEDTADTGFRIPAESKDSQENSPALVTPRPTPTYEPDGDRHVTFDELDEIFNVKHSREQQIESLFRLLNEKAKKNVIPHQYTCPNGYHWIRNKNQEIPKTQIAFSLPTIQAKRIPRQKQEVRASARDLRAKREITSNRRLHAELPSCKRKSLPSVKTARENSVRGGYELRKQQSYRKEPKLNLSPSRITNRKRRELSTTQRRESTSIEHKTNNNFILQTPKARQPKRRSASRISEPKRVITSRNVQENLERCSRKEEKCVPEHYRRHPKKKRVSSVSNNTRENLCPREPTEQGCFHWGRADRTQVLWDACTSEGSTTSYSPRTDKKRLGRNEKSGYFRNGESLKYGRVCEKIPHAFLKEVEPINKKVQFDTPRMYSTGPSRSRNKPLLASHRLH